MLVANYWSGSGGPDTRARCARSRVSIRRRPWSHARRPERWAGTSARAWTCARGAFLVYLDGDGQVSRRPHWRFTVAWKTRCADVAKGRRSCAKTARFARSPRSDTTRSSGSSSGRPRLWDINGQPKGLTRAAYKRLDLRTDDWFTDAEIVLKARAAGLQIVEVPVRFRPRQTSGSLVGIGTVWEFLVNMARWRLGRHEALTARPPDRRRSRAVARARR